jgi:hypothetical protein
MVRTGAHICAFMHVQFNCASVPSLRKPTYAERTYIGTRTILRRILTAQSRSSKHLTFDEEEEEAKRPPMTLLALILSPSGLPADYI